MIEQKFKAWDSLRKRMSLPFLLFDGHVNFAHDDYSDMVDYSSHSKYIRQDRERFVILQYTGLIDKIGNDIYNRVFLKHPNGTIYTVKWSQNGYYITVPGKELLDALRCKSLEVIGNIYENPELLEA